MVIAPAENETTSVVESSIPEQESSIAEPTTEELTRSLVVTDMVGKWKAGRYIWTIEKINDSVLLTSVYDWVDATTDAPELKDEYIKSSVFTGYNEVSGMMEGKLYHYTGTSTEDWYPITVTRDKDGISIRWKNLTFVTQ